MNEGDEVWNALGGRSGEHCSVLNEVLQSPSKRSCDIGFSASF
jgi:hypothetical protein